MMTDPVADMLTRIRNAVRIERPHVDMPLSKVKRGVAEVLKREGYIWEWEEIAGQPASQLRVAFEIRPQRRARDPPHSPRQQARPPGVQRRHRFEAGAQRPGNFDPQHQPRRDQRSRGPAAEAGRRSAVRIVVKPGNRSKTAMFDSEYV